MTAIHHLLSAAVLLASLALVACDNPEYWTFREDVTLNTGEKVHVQRKLRRNNVWPRIGNDGYRAVVDDWLSEKTYQIEWQSSVHGGGGHPISIGIISGQVFIATGQGKGLEYCISNPTAYNVRLFRQTSGGWQEVDQSDQLLSQLSQNMLLTLEWSEPSDPKPSAFSVEAKAERDHERSLGAHTLKEYLEGTRNAKCETTLQRAGHSPQDSAPANSSAQKQ